MKQLRVVNIQENSKKGYTVDRMQTVLKAQIENSLELGWDAKNILLITNFPFVFMDVRAMQVKLNKRCLTGSKLYGIDYILKNKLDGGEIVWCADNDLWESTPLELPPIADIGISTYSSIRKMNGGSVFWRSKAKDILDAILKEIEVGKEKEEPSINKILHSGKYDDRYTILDHSYNVGCSGYVPRALLAAKPIKCIHMNPYNRISWQTHRLNRDGVGITSVSERLEKLLRKYFELADILPEKDKIRQAELKERHKSKMNKYLGKTVKKEKLKSELCKDCVYYLKYKK